MSKPCPFPPTKHLTRFLTSWLQSLPHLSCSTGCCSNSETTRCFCLCSLLLPVHTFSYWPPATEKHKSHHVAFLWESGLSSPGNTGPSCSSGLFLGTPSSRAPRLWQPGPLPVRLFSASETWPSVISSRSFPISQVGSLLFHAPLTPVIPPLWSCWWHCTGLVYLPWAPSFRQRRVPHAAYIWSMHVTGTSVWMIEQLLNVITKKKQPI